MAAMQRTDTLSEVDESEFTPRQDATPVPRTGANVHHGGTAVRAANTQARIAALQPKGRVAMPGMESFGGYKPSGTKVSYGENKIGVMSDLSSVIEDIAAHAGVNMGDADSASAFLDALVTDVYVNPYSDKQTFEGSVVVRGGGFTLERRHIMAVIQPKVGNNYRRYARAMAPLVHMIINDNPDYNELLDKRCNELNLSTRAEASVAFDGADALPLVDRAAARRNAEAKNLALTARTSHRAYGMSNSAATVGDHTIQSSLDNSSSL